MKKKTYKQMQNRLYREIKRRIIAEKCNSIEVKPPRPNIDTIAVRQILSREACLMLDESTIKKAIARRVVDKLYDDNYFIFYTRKDSFVPILDQIEIECRLKVAKPE